MTWKVTVLFLLLLCSLVAAEDVNTSSMTTEELQAYISSLQEQAKPMQPMIVTIDIDDELRKNLDMLQNEVSQLKQTNERMQERFAQFVTDNKSNLDAMKTDTYNQTETRVRVITGEQTTELKEWTRLQTSPVRMNLPTVGVFFMLTAVFLLWTSKLYGRDE